MYFWASDFHACHYNIMRFCNRPFTSVDEMNEALIENWNSKVSPKDTVYHLGDFGFGREEDLRKVFNKLNGMKFNINGNHDDKNVERLPWQHTYKNVFGKRINDQYIWMPHYPHSSWNISYHGSWNVFGHVHSKGNWWNHGYSCDVGIDNWNLSPVSFEELEALFSKIKAQATGEYFMWRGNPTDDYFDFINIEDFGKISYRNEGV